MRLSPKAVTFALTLLLGAYASAQTLAGTVNNGTGNKPAAGDEVILFKLGAGMEEVAHTKTDGAGKFSFKLDDSGMPHLIRVVHQDVTYHQMAPPGSTSVDVQVFDVAKKVESVSVTADVMRIQTDGNQLQVVRLFAVNNASSPPKTQMKDANFEFSLPEGAQITQGMARTAGGQPLNSEPVPQHEKNHYAFNFPLRPGETQFQISYAMPYSGSAQFDPKSPYAMEHFVVMVPKSMQFTAGSGAQFQSMNDPQQPDATVEVAQRVEPGQPLGFKVTGTGTINMSGSEGGGETAQTGGRDARPGGGLGPPIDAPDPLQKYRWYIIGGFLAVLVAGAIYVTSRQNAAAVATGRGSVSDLELPPSTVSNKPAREGRVVAAGAAPVPAAASAASAAPRPMILEALKEEIFQLEMEHKQGRIAQDEYEKAKAALDATLERALKRQAQKV